MRQVKDYLVQCNITPESEGNAFLSGTWAMKKARRGGPFAAVLQT
jgi:hypothetical protein